MPPVVGKESGLLTPQQTWLSILAQLPAPPVVDLPLADGLGHVLREPIHADRDLPPVDRSAMDGFAVRAEDLAAAPVTLSVLGEVAAGSAAAPSIPEGACVRIYTGANLPPGTNTVVKLEDTRAAGPGRVTFERPERKGANLWRAGENARRGDQLVPAGTVLGALHIGLGAAVGSTRVRVARKPRVALLTTGRELQPPEAPVGSHQERDANGPLLAAALSEGGFALVSADRVTDDPEAIVGRLRVALATADAVVTSGGVSVGAYDFMPAATEGVGARTIAHGVAMKPGKPFLFAMAPGDQPIFALPGNPLSAVICFHEFVLPALRRMAGFPEETCQPLVRARLQVNITGELGPERRLPGRLAWTAASPVVAPVPYHSSADLAASARADGSIVVPSGVREIVASTLVDFRPWRRLP